jgi:hypothetical protein
MTTPTLTLMEFLLARITEDEAVARAVVDESGCGPTRPIGTGSDPWRSERAFAEHLTPARVLAECDAKRRIVADALDFAEQYRVERTPTREGMRWAAMVAAGQLATAYANHTDYRDEWKP